MLKTMIRARSTCVFEALAGATEVSVSAGYSAGDKAGSIVAAGFSKAGSVFGKGVSPISGDGSCMKGDGLGEMDGAGEGEACFGGRVALGETELLGTAAVGTGVVLVLTEDLAFAVG